MAAAGACHRHHWLEHSCAYSLGPGRDAIVYAAKGALVLRRADGEKRVKYAGCLAGGADIHAVLALAGGRALAFGYTTSGGNWIESGSVEDTVDCLVDFEKGQATSIDPGLFIRDMRHFDASVGPRTGWVVVHSLIGPPRVIDVARGVAQELDASPHGADHAVAAASDGGDVLVSSEYEEVSASPPRYRYRLVVRDIGPAWPPTGQITAEIPLGGRADRVRVSDDGRWAAYSGTDHVSGGASSDLGLIDLSRAAIVWQRLDQPGDVAVADVVEERGSVRVLIMEREPLASDSARLRWLGDGGQPRGGEPDASRTANAFWLPWRRRVVLDRYCELDELDRSP